MAYELDRTPARTGALHGRLEVALEGVALLGEPRVVGRLARAQLHARAVLAEGGVPLKHLSRGVCCGWPFGGRYESEQTPESV